MGPHPPVLTRAAILALPLIAAAGATAAPAATKAAAAQTVVVDSAIANPNGTYTVWIAGAPHLALDEAAVRRTRLRDDSLRTALATIPELETIVRAREGEVAAMTRETTAARSLIDGQRAQIATCEALVRQHRIAAGRRFSLALGAGYGPGDEALGALGALTYDRWGLWGLAASERPWIAGLTWTVTRF